MERILILVNTYFQLIVALEVVREYYPKSIIDIMITDASNGAETVAQELKSIDYINDVYYVRIKKIALPFTLAEKIRSCLKVVNYKSIGKYLGNIDKKKYDRLLFHNMDFFTYCLVMFLLNKNKKLVFERFEEGYSIYLRFNNREKSSAFCEQVEQIYFHRKLSQEISNVYLFHPHLLGYHMNYPIKQIRKIDRNDHLFVSLLNRIFKFDDIVSMKQKYILFAESYGIDGIDVNDTELFKFIADVVPKESVIIKKHPRDTSCRYKDLNIAEMEKSQIPWEVIQLNYRFNDKCFITISSGSVLASMLYYGDNVPTIFLFELLEKKGILQPGYKEYLQRLRDSVDNQTVHIPHSREELETILNRMENIAKQEIANEG